MTKYIIIKRLVLSLSTVLSLLFLVGLTNAYAGCYNNGTYPSPIASYILTNGYSTVSYSTSVILSTPTAAPINALTSVLWKGSVNGTKTTTNVQPVIRTTYRIYYDNGSYCDYTQDAQGPTTSSSTTFIPTGSVDIKSPDLSTQPLCTAAVVNGVSSCNSSPAIKAGTFNYYATFIPAPNSGPTSSSNSNTITLVENPNLGILAPVLSMLVED